MIITMVKINPFMMKRITMSIYGVEKIGNPLKTVKLGSTINLPNRMKAVITYEPDFDNTTHKIRRYDILNDKFNCYEIDALIKQFSKNMGFPYEKYNGTGGTEHYHFTTYQPLHDFFDSMGIEYEYEDVNVDELRGLIQQDNSLDYVETVVQDIHDIQIVNSEVTVSFNQSSDDLKEISINIPRIGDVINLFYKHGVIGSSRPEINTQPKMNSGSYREIILESLRDKSKKTYTEIYDEHKEVIPSFSRAEKPWMSINEWLQKLRNRGFLERRQRGGNGTMEYWRVDI